MGCPQAGTAHCCLLSLENKGRVLFFMAYGALDQLGFVLPVTVLAERVRRIFEGFEFFRHSGLAVMTDLAFFDLLSFRIGQAFPCRALAVMAGFALQSRLVRTVRERCRFWLFCRINGRFQDEFRRAFVGCPCCT